MDLIIGANGYLGQYLARAHAKKRCVLHSLSAPNPICAQTQLPFVEEDLCSSFSRLATLTPTTVYLLARPSTQNARDLLRFALNIESLLHLWANGGSLERVVFASTQLVYATPRDANPIAVDSPLGPQSPYDCHKAHLEFFLELLAHHECGLRVETYRLPLLAGLPTIGKQAYEQLLSRWRQAYSDGERWSFQGPQDDAWGNSWVHVDDVVRLMLSPTTTARHSIVQPVSGHFTYRALDRLFTGLGAPPALASLQLPRSAFFLEGNVPLRQRPVAEAFPDGIG